MCIRDRSQHTRQIGKRCAKVPTRKQEGGVLGPSTTGQDAEPSTRSASDAQTEACRKSVSTREHG
eukprot:5520422-Pleurochrysis_carterae.AAC.1